MTKDKWVNKNWQGGPVINKDAQLSTTGVTQALERIRQYQNALYGKVWYPELIVKRPSLWLIFKAFLKNLFL